MNRVKVINLIKAGAERRRGRIPRRPLGTLMNIDTISPGLDSVAIYEAKQHKALLEDGGILILAGKPGVGKTVAAFVMALMIGWQPRYIKRGNKKEEISAKPPDQEHPFGHGRVERIVSIVIACMLIVVSIEFFINGINRLQNPVPVEFQLVIVIILAITIGAKILLSIITFDLGKIIGSSALKADAWHHSTDAISTVLVIIGFILYRFGMYYIDGVIAIIIALFIAYTGITIIIESGSILVGEAPSPKFTEQIKELALFCGGVTDVHHIHVHDYGGITEVTVHIRLRADMHLDAAHAKATEVEQCIKEHIEGVEVTVHAEPAGKIHDR